MQPDEIKIEKKPLSQEATCSSLRSPQLEEGVCRGPVSLTAVPGTLGRRAVALPHGSSVSASTAKGRNSRAAAWHLLPRVSQHSGAKAS